MLTMENNVNEKRISVLGAFALSVGTAIGWGSFVVTGSDFVSKAGPIGSTIGLIIGMLIMMVVAYNYHYMMKRYPDTNGGIYSFAKYTIGRPRRSDDRQDKVKEHFRTDVNTCRCQVGSIPCEINQVYPWQCIK